jgi:hypothetical protein
VTLDEAREHVGAKVLYCEPGSAPSEEGVITSVNEHYVFVRYGADYGSKATHAHRLDLLTSTP